MNLMKVIMRTIKFVCPASTRSLIIALTLSSMPLDSFADESTVSIMRRVYDSIAYLLPLSLRDPAQGTEWDQALITDKLEVLKNASSALKQHSAGQEEEFHHLAGSFDDLSKNLTTAFSKQWPEFAYFSLMDLVEHCVACHSRLPTQSQALFGERLIARMDTRELPPAEVVKLFVAVRHFDAALRLIEKTLMDPKLTPLEADTSGLLVQYLQITIGARRSPGTAQKFLQRYLARGDLPFYLEHRIDFWLSSIEELTGRLAEPPKLEIARKIFYHADPLSRGPGNRLRAVHDITAASIIRAYLAQPGPHNATELGEAYYILGVVALRTLDAKFAVPEMELLLASSIRAEPTGKHARESYALIEEYGFIRGEPLGDASSTQTVVDMSALRDLIGL
ncbi:MAG: hypothetical protein ACI915_004970 [Gammaproteobacteria bacterium]|jgi:hypothetical protein